MTDFLSTGAGVVVALGPDVDPNEWKVGDRAGVKPYYSTCGKCSLCKTGEASPHCAEMPRLMTKLCWPGSETYCASAVLHGSGANGSYSQYCLTYADYTSRIPEGLPDHIAAPVLCSGAT